MNTEEKEVKPNLDNIINLPCFYLAKVVAMKIKQSGYASVSMFFENIPQSDLETIVDKFMQINNPTLDKEDVANRYTDVSLLAMVLAHGEGKNSLTIDEMALAIDNLRRLSFVTLFDRKGRAVANYKNFSVIEPWNFSKVVKEQDDAT